jgi:hypothetical protein
MKDEDASAMLPDAKRPSFALTHIETQDHKTSPRSGSCRTCGEAAHARSSRTHTQPSGHPARGRFRCKAGLLACGSRHPACLPSALRHQWTDRSNARRLQLRGQLRHCLARHGHHAPYSRLSFRRESEEPRTLDIVDEVKFPSTGTQVYPCFSIPGKRQLTY